MENIEQKKQKIKKWLKDPYHLALVGILLFSFILLIYYFNLTKTQTLWWDEAEYMSTAKHWAFDVDYNINPQRPPLFSFLIFILYSVGFGELAIKFLLELVPMLLSVFFTYLLILEMYENKKLALLTAFITSVSWIHIFYSMRFMTDTLSFLFGILAFFCFWKGYINKKGKTYIWLIGFFVALSFLTKLTGILYGLAILLFLFVTLQFDFLKDKDMWISFFISLLTIAPYLIWSYFYYGNALAFRSGYGEVSGKLGWHIIKLVYDYPELIFFVLFLVGLTTLIPMFLSLDRTILKKDKKYYNDFFITLTVIFALAFFIYFLRDVENRWLILMSTGIFTISAKGILLVYNAIKRNFSKNISIILLVILLFAGAYVQLKHTDNITRLKVNTYVPVKEAALWIKENSNPSDIIITSSITQNTYYAERKSVTFFNDKTQKYYTPEEYDQVILDLKPKYLIISVFEPAVPQWTYSYPQRNISMYQPVKAWFSDPQQTQPILIIYEVNYEGNPGLNNSQSV